MARPYYTVNNTMIDISQLVKKDIINWVEENVNLMKPNNVYICNGSKDEYNNFIEQMLRSNTLIKLNSNKHPNSYLARSDPTDVARVENRTFICSLNKEDSGPNNNWMDPTEMINKLNTLYDGCMNGKTMYVIPYCMGPIGSKYSRIGFEITDSLYVVCNMYIMTRIGIQVLDWLNDNYNYDIVYGLHSVGSKTECSWPCNPIKYITHFPHLNSIMSFGSGYGGNALLGKKCFSLRIASNIARREGWLAEHMLILGITNPKGIKKYFLAAFPSQCGKTNLAMMRSTLPGWKIECLGDDIAWIFPTKDGFYAINPENGFFGVATGTSNKTNPNAMKTIIKNTIFTNVALTDDGDVWWEGKTDELPSHLIDWQGNDWTPNSNCYAAHPNSRFTVSSSQCPSIDPEWNNLDGVPISAIIFGGRRSTTIPLVLQSYDWNHGVFLGANISSQTTAAAEGVVGKLRHDPFAMLPFCGYNMGDYFQHWLNIGKNNNNLPKIFQVNWFKKFDDKYLWPGFGENVRVLKWIFEQCDSNNGINTPVGILPQNIDIKNLYGVNQDTIDQLLNINKEEWISDLEDSENYFKQFGDRLPKEILEQINNIKNKL